MDAKRFDRLSRAVFVSASRRQAVGVLLAVLGLSGSLDALAAKNEQRHRRRKRRQQKRRRVRGGGQQCIALDQVCSAFSGPSCCAGTECKATIALAVTTCQSFCNSTAECEARFRGSDVECIRDTAACPGLLFSSSQGCCRPRVCHAEGHSSECPGSGLCCRGLTGTYCCLRDQVCVEGHGCTDRFAAPSFCTDHCEGQVCCAGTRDCCPSPDVCNRRGCR